MFTLNWHSGNLGDLIMHRIVKLTHRSPLRPLPLLLMLCFSQPAPSIPGCLFYLCKSYAGGHSCRMPSTTATTPRPQNSFWGRPSILWLLQPSHPSWGCSLGQAGASLRAEYSAVTYPEHPGHFGFSALTIALCKKKLLWPERGAH